MIDKVYYKLDNESIHVHSLEIPNNPENLLIESNFLSNDEILRANKFRNQIDKQKFLISRTFLREILSIYLNIDPKDIKFNYGENGKPLISQEINFSNLQFNLSHSKNIAACALSLNEEIGIDIEFNDNNINYYEIAESYFNNEENKLLRSLKEQESQNLFYKIWTIKEAFLKSLGFGLSFPLSGVKIHFGDNISPGVVSYETKTNEIKKGFILIPDLPNNYSTAVVTLNKYKNMFIYKHNF